MRIGYARVSTVGQDTQVQVARLLELGVEEEHVYTDKGFTGKTMTRDGLQNALKALRKGDVLVVPAMDRLARNARDTLAAVDRLTDQGVGLDVGGMVYQPGSPMSRLFVTILAAVAEAEGGWISTRTKEAMARPDVKSRLKGRGPALTPVEDASIAALVGQGTLTVAAIARRYKVSRASVHRALARHQARGGAVE